jgi:ADP-ribosylglycohydrolase
MGVPTPTKPTPLRNTYWVLPGKVLAGEHPGGTNTEATRERLQRLIEAGVECFIDLTEPGELKTYDTQLPFGIEYLRKPIKDHGIPARRMHMAEILDCLHDTLSSGRGVYVHCRAGIGRTGTVVGCFLVERGLVGDAALNELNRLWQQCERSQSWASIPETDEQVQFVRGWKARAVFNESGHIVAPALENGDGEPLTSSTAPWAHLLVGSPEGSAPLRAARGVNATQRERPAAATPRAPAPNLPGLLTDPTVVARPPVGDSAGTARASAAAGKVSINPQPPPGLPSSQTLDEANPLLESDALSAASHLRGRFLGALLGLAVGDAVAAATQYRRPGTFAPLGDMLGGGPFDLPRGGWSDDTAMALCLADSLLECNGFDARDQVERYRRWQQEGYLSATGQCVGVTASSARAIAMAQWRRQAFSGSHDPGQLDPEPLSRLAPAVLFFFASSGQAIEQATEAARTTCQAPPVLDACRSLARALHAALSGQPKSAVLEQAALAGNAPSARSTSGGGGARGSEVGVGAGAPAALATAVAAFNATDNFRDAILYAANLGGDSDVVTAVCGQLAGAYYSVNAIPTSWRNSLMRKELIVGYADRLLARAMLSLAG